MANPLPGSQITKVNGNLSLVPQGTPVPWVIGPCSLPGTGINTAQTFSQINALNSTLGYGPAVTEAQIILRAAGGSVVVVPSSGSNVGYAGLITSSSNGPTFSTSGAPYETYQAQAVITTAGTLSTAYFQYTLDGTQTFSSPLPITGTFVVPNTNLTWSFGAGSYTLGQTYAVNYFAPTPNSTDLTNAYQAVSGSNVSPLFIALACDYFTGSQGATTFTGMDAELTTLDNINLFPGAIVPTGGQNGQTATTISAFASVASAQGNVCMAVAERANCVIPAPFQGYGNPQLPFAYAVAQAAASTFSVAQNPAEKALGGIPGWSNPTYDELVNGATYITNKIVAPRTWKNAGGVFMNQAFCKVSAGSPFVYWQWGQVINLIAETIQPALDNLINKSQQTLTDGTGRLTPAAANNIDSTINSLLRAAIMQPQNGDGFTGLASGVLFQIDRAYNVLSNSAVQGFCTYVPLANVSKANVQIAFSAALPTT